MAEIINFSDNHHPVGGKALHKTFGLVDVVDADGMMRQVVYEDDSKPCAEFPHINLTDAWVHVSSLKEANLYKDVMSLVREGHI